MDQMFSCQFSDPLCMAFPNDQQGYPFSNNILGNHEGKDLLLESILSYLTQNIILRNFEHSHYSISTNGSSIKYI